MGSRRCRQPPWGSQGAEAVHGAGPLLTSSLCPQWIMDVLVCNGLGIYCGMKTLEWLSMKTYKWQGLWNIPTYKCVPSLLLGGPRGPEVALGHLLGGVVDQDCPWAPGAPQAVLRLPSPRATRLRGTGSARRALGGGTGHERLARPRVGQVLPPGDSSLCPQRQDEEDRLPVHALQLGPL